MFQKSANSEGVRLQIEKILDDFIWNDPLTVSVKLSLIAVDFVLWTLFYTHRPYPCLLTLLTKV